MKTVKNVVFDLGGVIVDLDNQEAIRRFQEIGVADAHELLNTYEQKGIFLELENGKIDLDDFCRELSKQVGRELSTDDVIWGWLGFLVEAPQYKLDYILQLRNRYNIYLLSNTNPAIQDGWARTNRFSSAGRPISNYFDKIYTSYEIGITKPDPGIFEYMLKDAGMVPSETLFVDDGERNIETALSMGFITYQPKNKEDWREPVSLLLA